MTEIMYTLFVGILTFTRIYGVPFEGFIMGGGKEDGKKGAKKKPPPAKGKKGAKGKKVQEVAPKLQQFPPVAEDLVKVRPHSSRHVMLYFHQQFQYILRLLRMPRRCDA